jgi:hypothetical protein
MTFVTTVAPYRRAAGVPNDGSALFVRSGRKQSATPPVRSGERL